MPHLTFYGGVGEIGGNKILLEDGDTALFFDFGTPFRERGKYFEEYLNPRQGAGLLDLLEMGLLPPLRGIYREDLDPKGSFTGRCQSHPLYRELRIDGVLLSHAHLDHSGYVSFLRPDIPIYTTAMTAFIAKAIQDSGKSDFEHEVCYAIPKEETDGVIQSIHYRRGPAQQRPFRIFDPQPLGAEGQKFWADTPGERALLSQALGHTEKGGGLPLGHFPVDHSIFGAAAMGVETSAGWVVYTGDLRLRGSKGHLSEAFIREASRLRPAVLLCEGTNIGSQRSVSEEEVYTRSLEAIKGARALVFADFGPRNVERLLTFRRIAQETGRSLVILAKDAYLLEKMHLLSPEIPDLSTDPVIYVYHDAKASLDKWERGIRVGLKAKLVKPEDISGHQDSYILCFSFFDINRLPSLQPQQGSLYLYSSSEVFDEEGAMDMMRLHNWLDHFQMRRVGLPVKKRSRWDIPEGERGLHASGHASGRELLEMIKWIRPRVLIPIHTERRSQKYFTQGLAGTDIQVHLPALGKKMAFPG